VTAFFCKLNEFLAFCGQHHARLLAEFRMSVAPEFEADCKQMVGVRDGPKGLAAGKSIPDDALGLEVFVHQRSKFDASFQEELVEMDFRGVISGF